MSESITWLASFRVANGPSLAQAGTLSVTAYDKISIELAAAATGIDVQLQPSTTSGEVRLLVITASAYDAGVTLSSDAGVTTSPLDGPLTLIGAGAVTLLADPPQVLRFANPGAVPVDVDILVGRDA